jgi:multiple sugar transport system permease protein
MTSVRAYRTRSVLVTVAKWVIVVLFALWTVIPIAIVVTNSFKTPLDIFTERPKLIFHPTIDNFVQAFVRGDFLKYYINSTVVAVVSTIFVLFLATFAAYALTSFGFRWANWIANGFLVGRLVPVIAMLLPLFVIMNMTGIRGTLLAPIIAHAALQLPFMIWLLIGFMRDVPQELQQAALVDGATKMQTFWRIVMPIILPGLAAAFILSMQYSWNELLFSLQLTSFDTYTLPVGIAGFVGAVSVNAGQSSAAATATMVPMIVLGFFIQKYLAAGTTAGAVKG